MIQEAISKLQNTRYFLSAQIDGSRWNSFDIESYSNEKSCNIKANFSDKSKSFLVISLPFVNGKKVKLERKSYNIVSIAHQKNIKDICITATFISSPVVFYSVNGTLTITHISDNKLCGYFDFETKDLLGMTSVSIKSGKFSIALNCNEK